MSDPTKASDFNRVVDHFLSTKPKPHDTTKPKTKAKRAKAKKAKAAPHN